MGEVSVLACINRLKNSQLCYPFCQVCLCKIYLSRNGRWSCFRCGHWQLENNVQYRYRLTLNLTDGVGLCEVTLFGSCLDKIFGDTAGGFLKRIQELESSFCSINISMTNAIYQALNLILCSELFAFTFKVPSKHLQDSNRVDLHALKLLFNDGSRNKNSRGIVAQDICFVSDSQICTVNQILDRLLLVVNSTEWTGLNSNYPSPLLPTKKDLEIFRPSQSVESQSHSIRDNITSEGKGNFLQTLRKPTFDSQNSATENPTEACGMPTINADKEWKSESTTPNRDMSDSFINNLCRSLLKGVSFSPWVDEDLAMTSKPPTIKSFDPTDDSLDAVANTLVSLNIQKERHPSKATDEKLDFKTESNVMCRKSSARYLKCTRQLIPVNKTADDSRQYDFQPLAHLDRPVHIYKCDREMDDTKQPSNNSAFSSISQSCVYTVEDLNCHMLNINRTCNETLSGQQHCDQETLEEKYGEDENSSTAEQSYCSSPVLFD